MRAVELGSLAPHRRGTLAMMCRGPAECVGRTESYKKQMLLFTRCFSFFTQRLFEPSVLVFSNFAIEGSFSRARREEE